MVFTILIPIGLIATNMEVNGFVAVLLIALFFLFYYINHNTHKLYLENEVNSEIAEIEEEAKWIRGKKKLIVRYSIYLVLTGIFLFMVGNALSNTLENLCVRFNVPQVLVGIALGFITSIPELITFFEAQKHHKEKGQDDMLGVVEATNNLLTSNVLNLFLIQSVGILLNAVFL